MLSYTDSFYHREIHMKKLGIIGYRGMVGTVLCQNMAQADDFKDFTCHFFSSSHIGEKDPYGQNTRVKDSYKLDDLLDQDILICTQGSSYTAKIRPLLQEHNWPGYWIDAASFLRNDPQSTLILDPVNQDIILQALDKGIKNFIGANCTVSLLLMAIAPLIKMGLIENIFTSSYQAVSGAGMGAVQALLAQTSHLNSHLDPDASPLEKIKALTQNQYDQALKHPSLEANLAYNVLPFIDEALENGQSKEEHKAAQETQKILGLPQALPMDGFCVRTPTLRAHAQAVEISLKKHLPLEAIANMLHQWHQDVYLIAPDKKSTLEALTPLAVSDTLNIHIGRLRTLQHRPNTIGLFTVGDQLHYGAAEPLRRFLKMLT